jgi:hypothetical protein
MLQTTAANQYVFRMFAKLFVVNVKVATVRGHFPERHQMNDRRQ